MVLRKSGDGPNLKGPKRGRSGQYAGHPRADTRQWTAATSFFDCIAQGSGGRYPSRGGQLIRLFVTAWQIKENGRLWGAQGGFLE